MGVLEITNAHVDIAINRGAPITVMTTEVFRNMIYDPDSSNQLSDVFVVIFDEFHYMNDPDRGTVWEECVISCPSHIRILALSATMVTSYMAICVSHMTICMCQGNVEDIQGWFEWTHGPTSLVASDYRPVPLRYLFALKSGLLPLFRDPNSGPGAPNGVKKLKGNLEPGSVLNPSIVKLEEQALKKSLTRSTPTRPFRNPKPNAQALVPRFIDIAEDLHNLKLLPAIVFIFSRAGCEQAAKAIAQMRTKLLSEEDVRFVTQAIGLFAKNNPEIPIQKSVVVMLKAGVAVHHAGLIPVWKAFIEDLFNANKVKVLFATETLAAGVNMPARTTVISTVTKRINSEVVRLKTSQLLQMAGRAGRRGKDIEGTVVLMRSKFEDAKMSHNILTSRIDGIKSHFRTSYGLTIRLLETKSLEECRALIERGFSSYLLQKRNKGKVEDTFSAVDGYKDLLRRYTLQGARDYFKLIRRLEKERKNEEFQVERIKEADVDLVQAIADYMPLGIGLHLKNGESGFFLGDVKWGNNNANSGLGVISSAGDTILIVNKQHIRSFADTVDSLTVAQAQDLLDLVGEVSDWEEAVVPGCKKVALRGKYDMQVLHDSPKRLSAVERVLESRLLAEVKEPGSLAKQRTIIQTLEQELSLTAIEVDGTGSDVLDALKYAVAQKDPIGFVNSPSKTPQQTETFAWKMFKSVMAILHKYEALDGTTSTVLGQLVGSLSADNELWLALVLQRPKVIALSPAALAAVMCGVVTDGFKASNAFFRQKPSDSVEEAFSELADLAIELNMAQSEADVDFPINLCRESGGLIEQWVEGANWRDLCKDTSLDQGDVCRMLRRTVEVLRQIPMAYGINPTVAQTAYAAAALMDRFPVADFDPNVDMKERAGVGYGITGDSVDGEDSELDEDLLYDDDMKIGQEDDSDFLREVSVESIVNAVSNSSLDDLLDELEFK